MKKIIYSLLLFIMGINYVYAFNIDIDKIDVNAKSKNLIKELDSMYAIETNNFNNEIIYDEDIVAYSRELLNIIFSGDDYSLIQQNLINNMHFSKENGFDTITGSLFIESFVETLKENKIEFKFIRDIKVSVFNENDRMVFVYLPECIVDKKVEDVVIAFWLKSNDGEEFRLFYPWITMDSELDEYFNDVTNSEEKNLNIGGSFRQMTLTNEDEISDSLLNEIYEKNKKQVVQITGMSETGSNAYGSGFYLRDGVVVTTWSLFLKFLTNSNYIFVNDVYGNTYNILGVISADINYDIVVLKIDKDVGQMVNFDTSSNVRNGDYLFTINSKSNSSFVINYGTNIGVSSGRLENMFLLSQEDVGSALFNQDGYVVGFNVADQLYSELSYANSTDYLRELQRKLLLQSYKDISYTKLDAFKESYYLELNKETTFNKIDNVVWGEYKHIGNIGDNIPLDLVKANYVDDVVSLRYYNNTNGMVDSIYLISDFTNELIKQGFKLTSSNEGKVVYTSSEYKVIIKDSFNYLIILIMEV